MRPRDFITFVCGAAVTWPVVARAEQTAIPLIGFLSSRAFMTPDIWLMRSALAYRLTDTSRGRTSRSNTVGRRATMIVFPRLQRNSQPGCGAGYDRGRTIRTGGESRHVLDTNRVHDRG